MKELADLSGASETAAALGREISAQMSPSMAALGQQFASTVATQRALDQALQPYREIASDIAKQVQGGAAAKARIRVPAQIPPGGTEALARAVSRRGPQRSFDALAVTIGDRLSEQVELDRRSMEALEAIERDVRPRRWPTWWEWVLLAVTVATLLVTIWR